MLKIDDKILISVDDLCNTQTFIDSSHESCEYMNENTGCAIHFGSGVVCAKVSKKKKMTSRSSTENKVIDNS